MLRELVETTDRARWRALLPGIAGLHIEETAAAAPVVALDEELRQGLLDAILAEGYYQHGPALPADTVGALAAAVGALRAAGHPLELAFVFDELWQIAHWLRPLFELVLGTGFRQLPALTIWHVGGGGDGSGWAPHRDRRGTLRSNGMPGVLSAWLALTDATPLNGCIHVLPKGLDHYYGSGEVGEVDLVTLQNVRALPAPAGSFLFWNHELLHWGGRASPRAPGPGSASASSSSAATCRRSAPRSPIPWSPHRSSGASGSSGTRSSPTRPCARPPMSTWRWPGGWSDSWVDGGSRPGLTRGISRDRGRPWGRSCSPP